MTRMKFKLFRSMFLLPFGVLICLTTGELEFYQDAVRNLPDDIPLEELARYIELKARQHQHANSMQHSRFPLYANQRSFREPLDFLRPSKERSPLSDELLREENILDLLQKQNLEALNYIQKHYKNLPYLGLETVFDRYPEYSHFKVPHNKERMDEQYPGLPERFADDDDSGEEMTEHNQQPYEPRLPQFTYKFAKPNLENKSPFAVAPNDPRYYQDGSFATEEILNHEHLIQNNPVSEEIVAKKLMQSKQVFKSPILNPNTVELNMMMEPHRRSEQDSYIYSVLKKPSDDVFLIVVMATICAVVMFVVVTMGFVWFRIQRIAKAAADIDYPAYGITGPNKDSSPSSDQRLAQSAQMYHFQHQKQQIIAMEKDPASVSEADSDEENEEGDYTVYECPGLAPTGEMEVKNPIFHDDPTPASPLHKKDENP